MNRHSASAAPSEVSANGRASRLWAALHTRVDGASLAVFRMLFGGLMAVGALRFMLSGWVRILYVEPTFFFSYPGLSWWKPWPEWGLYLHFGVVAVSALFTALGLYYRASVAVFTLTFAAAQLWDVTNYLNHYYLVVLLGALLCVVPAHATWSLDARRSARVRALEGRVPAWAVYLIRAQIGIVYFYAGLAKLGHDWLVHGQPLGIWLAARDEIPVLGSLFRLPGTALVMSWAGFLYDTTIPLWLSLRRTRLVAYLVLIAFHTATHILFQIGLFPFIMSFAALVFFPPTWPRRFTRSAAPQPLPSIDPTARRVWLRRLGFGLAAVYLAFQVAVPLRHFAKPGDVLWEEHGMRWSWKVMVRSKKGSLTYRVRPADQRRRDWEVDPLEYLQWRQFSEMSGQPDLIAQLARHIADDFAQRGLGPVQVRADAWISLNGRAPTRLVDPDVDLAQIDPDRDAWLLAAPTTPPLSALNR